MNDRALSIHIARTYLRECRWPVRCAERSGHGASRMTTQPQLIPKPPRRMLQPRKDAIRRRAEIAEAMLAYQRTPIWWRIWARVIEVDKPTAQARANHLDPTA